MSVIGPFRGQYYCFSTYFSSSFAYTLPTNGLNAIFANLECVIQAAKFNVDAARRLLATYGSDPRQVHRYGRTQETNDVYWFYLPHMLLEANLAKFQGSRVLRSKLMSTNPDYLINYNYWHDNYLGVCACSKCGHYGLNLLGLVLMSTRQRMFELDNQVDIHFTPPPDGLLNTVQSNYTATLHYIISPQANQDTPNGWMVAEQPDSVSGLFSVITPQDVVDFEFPLEVFDDELPPLEQPRPAHESFDNIPF